MPHLTSLLFFVIALTVKPLSCRRLVGVVLGMWIVGASVAQPFTYGPGEFPEFAVATDHRGFLQLSIHPDGERWLLGECTDRIDPPYEKCFLFVYNIKTGRYQRYDLPLSYSYTSAKFSKSGELIVAIRRPVAKDDSHQESARVVSESEIVLIDTEGSNFQVIPLRKGKYRTPTISPDGKKIAYWSAKVIRPEGSKTLLGDYDLYEFDLFSGKDTLFSSPFRFALVGQVEYVNPNQIIVEAYGSISSGKMSFNYSKKNNFSHLYCLDRFDFELTDPCLTEVASASNPSIDTKGNLFLFGESKKSGIGLFLVSDKKIKSYWKLPRLAEQGIDWLVAAPSANYLAFIYPTASPRFFANHRALGMFDIQSERWIPLSLPQPETAETIPLK